MHPEAAVFAVKATDHDQLLHAHFKNGGLQCSNQEGF